MLQKRIIPLLLLSENKIVKTEKFENPKYVGDPLNVLKIFNEKEVDELILVDISIRKKNYNLQIELLKQFASECYMPITYAGGIDNLKDAETILSLGFEKICVTNMFFNNPNTISIIANNFGKQSVVVKFDLKKNFFGQFKLYDHFNNKLSKIEINEAIDKAISLGAGEIIVNFVDNEGMRTGLQNKHLEKINLDINVPIILSGGINSLKNIKNLFEFNIDAVAVGSLFVYYGVHKAVLISYPSPQEKREILK